MIHSQLEKLLIVQEKDLKLQKADAEISKIPNEQQRLRQLIDKELNNIEIAKMDLNKKEILRNEIDNQIKVKESEIKKFKNQQLEVKKNEEYQALTHQIEKSEEEISNLEENEISIMYEIDEEKAIYEANRQRFEVRIKEQKNQIVELDHKLNELKNISDHYRNLYSESRNSIEGKILEQYDNTKSQVKRFPYIVPVENQTCTGCHLKLSNDVIAQCRTKEDLVFCDHCSRILYIN